MAYFRTSKNAAAAGGVGKCKKHPKHRQSPGVCSLCLAEKLNKICSSSTTSTSRRSNRIMESSSCSSSSSLSSGYSSCSASSFSSPVYRYDRYASMKGNTTSLLLIGGGGGSNRNRLTKSRTTVGNFGPKMTGAKEGGDRGRKNGKRGFFSRLLHPSGTLRVH